MNLAKNLKRKLKGIGWKIRVHENFGWHYTLYNKYIGISEYHYGTKHKHYSVLISSDIDSQGSRGDGIWTEPLRL